MEVVCYILLRGEKRQVSSALSWRGSCIEKKQVSVLIMWVGKGVIDKLQVALQVRVLNLDPPPLQSLLLHTC